MASKKVSTADRGARERRSAPRVQIVGELIGEPLSFDSTVTVLDLSTGGFSIETTTPLSVGESHQFRFSLGDRVSVIVLAKVVHLRKPSRRPAGTQIVGLEFLDGSAEAKASRTTLIKRIVSGALKSPALSRV